MVNKYDSLRRNRDWTKEVFQLSKKVRYTIKKDLMTQKNLPH